MASLLHQLIPSPMNISFSSHHITNNLVSPHCYNSSNSSILRFRLGVQKPKCGASEIEMGLPGGLEPGLMPNHVAIIMDGNRRWARSRGLSIGHKAGGEALKLITPIFNKCGVKILSVFVFSTENWARPKEEVDYLMTYVEENTETNIDKQKENDGRITFLGDRSQLSQSLQYRMSSAEERCKGNKGPHNAVCVNYSGRYDIIEAARKIARKVRNGSLQAEDINENVFEQHLETHVLEFPNPDLLIRTSGELRVSNYMMWQLANTDLYFTNKMFPDMKEEDVVEALAEFQRRQRQRRAS